MSHRRTSARTSARSRAQPPVSSAADGLVRPDPCDPRRAHRPAVRVAGTALLGVALLVGTVPAQASEVVKLARLLITGKRQPSKPPAAPQPTPSDRGGSTDAPGPQSKLTDDTPVQQAQVVTERRGTSEAMATMTMSD